MERPSRNKKVVNYSEFQDGDDDDDFTCVKVPPNKKARVQEKKDASKMIQSTSQEASSQQTAPKPRMSVDDKLYERNLEAALQISMTEVAGAADEISSDKCDENQSPQDLDKKAPSPLLSNCSVDTSLLGLDKITDEMGPQGAPSMRRKATSKAENEGDEDYQPACTPDGDSESDKNFSGNEESEDEEFTVTKNRSRKKASKKRVATHPPSSKKEAKSRKTTKLKEQPTETPTARRSAAPLRPASLPNVSKPAVPVSPAGGRLPKWNPPGQIGRSPTMIPKTQVKSPGQGLRLGLSRLARVKPLHPSVAHGPF